MCCVFFAVRAAKYHLDDFLFQRVNKKQVVIFSLSTEVFQILKFKCSSISLYNAIYLFVVYLTTPFQ
jgi:hypothetical protein